MLIPKSSAIDAIDPLIALALTMPAYKSSPSRINKGFLNSSDNSRACLNNLLSISESTKSLAVFLSIATSSLT